MKRFVTLGPGTNHDVVARRYLDFHGVDDSVLTFVPTPEEGVDAVLDGRADYLVLCSVHPDAAGITGRHHRRVFIVDTFLSASKPLAVLTRAEVAHPRRLGLFAPTRDYVDTSPWPEVMSETEGSIVRVWQGLRDGAYDSALVYEAYADEHPGRFRVDAAVGSPVDAWVVFGRHAIPGDGFSACRDSAVGRALAA